MKILSIETSCDETAVSIVEASGDSDTASFTILGNQLLSQIELHREYGGVYPSLAKREHSKNLIPLFEETLKEADLYSCTGTAPETIPQNPVIEKILEREPELLEQFLRLFAVLEKPSIDAVAVTHGPGLEPALWVGINFAKALAHVWDIPLIPVNHMEGHIFAALLKKKSSKEFTISNIQFPILALLISGGHTELVLSKKLLEYKVIGQTRDDAVGEAFDKVARMLGLPYPGGPEISKIAEQARNNNLDIECPSALGHSMSKLKLPRPMLYSDDFDFSFSGLKTAVLYAIRDLPRDIRNDPRLQSLIAREFEDAVTDVLLAKTTKALKQYGAKTLVVGGGVSANKHIRRTLEKTIAEKYDKVSLCIPEPSLSTDNAIMIAIAAYYRQITDKYQKEDIVADGNLTLSE